MIGSPMPVGDQALASRTWVLLTEAPDGGWGLGGHANTHGELVAAAPGADSKPASRHPAAPGSAASQCRRSGNVDLLPHVEPAG